MPAGHFPSTDRPGTPAVTYNRHMQSRYSGANEAMRNALARVAPGMPLRDGIDRVVRSKAGALLVLSDDPEVLSICSGGFLVDAPFSPQRLSELAKMDGAIIISNDGGRIARANVHLVPDPTVPTSETGTRHRTAERVARSLDVPVISASEEMGVINVYAGGTKRQLQEIGRLLDRANQALQTLERYKLRLDDAISNLTALEIEDVVTVRDVVSVVQRGEMVHRIADEIETMIIELGVDARLLRLQLDEIYTEIDDELDLVVADYLPPLRQIEDTMAEMSRLRDDDVLDARMALTTLHLGDVEIDDEVAPKGLRLLSRVHTLPNDLAAKIANHFGGLARLQRSTVDDLMRVDGVDETIAATVKETLERVTENTILDQYS
jgi:diadenylate cyclase